MNRITFDASVLIKCFIEEEWSQQASEIAAKAKEIFVPDLVFCEIGNILWKKVNQRLLKADDSMDLLEDILAVRNLKIVPYRILVSSALRLAHEINCTMYDGMYLAASLHERVPLVTDDKRLYEKAFNAGYNTLLLKSFRNPL